MREPAVCDRGSIEPARLAWRLRYRVSFRSRRPPPGWRQRRRKPDMLYYALIFFVVALVAAALGMRGVAGMSANIGYTLVFVALIFLVVALVSGRAPPVP